MTFEEILRIAIVVLTFVIGTAIPFIIALVKAIKERNKAKTAEEKAQANADLLNLANQLITAAEATYNDYNTYMKSKGLSAGADKKKSVLTDLKDYALSKSYEWDADKWSATIDEIVALTRNVNAK